MSNSNDDPKTTWSTFWAWIKHDATNGKRRIGIYWNVMCYARTNPEMTEQVRNKTLFCVEYLFISWLVPRHDPTLRIYIQQSASRADCARDPIVLHPAEPTTPPHITHTHSRWLTRPADPMPKCLHCIYIRVIVLVQKAIQWTLIKKKKRERKQRARDINHVEKRMWGSKVMVRMSC